MKLIDKDALVAEIDKRKIGYNTDGKHTVEYNTVKKILDILDTLEVKEVDLEEEITHYFKGWGNNEIHCFAMMQDGTSVGIDECIDIAKHFFELGLNSSVPMTWEDIRNIDHILDGMRNENQVFGYPKFHEEALRRFKAQKGE